MSLQTYSRWYDVQGYTSVIATVKTGTSVGGYSNPMTIQWGQGDNDDPPYDANLVGGTEDDRDVIATDSFPDMSSNAVNTLQFDTRSRWIRFVSEKDNALDASISLAHNFKVAPTELRIRDEDTGDLVQVTNNHMRILLTDSSGNIIEATRDNSDATSERTALYTSLTDVSGSALGSVGATGDRTLAISVRDTSNSAVASTTDQGNVHLVNQDLTKFPSTDILFLVGRSYSMTAGDTTNHIERAYDFINEFQTQIDTMGGFSGTNTRITVVGYGRADVSTDQPVNVTYAHGDLGGADEPTERTIIPGVIEYQDYSPKSDFAIHKRGNKYTHTAPVDACGAHHVHTVDVSAVDGYKTLLVPGNNIYTTITHLLQPGDSSVGNILPYTINAETSTYGNSMSVLPGRRAVVVALTDSSFTDDKTSPAGDGVFRDSDLTRLTTVHDTAHDILKTNYDGHVYAVVIGGTADSTVATFVSPSATTVPSVDSLRITSTHTYSDGARIIDGLGTDVTNAAQLLAKTIYGTEHIGGNAMKTVFVDGSGTEQAATEPVQGAHFGGRALYYALSDKDGIQYSTTKNDTCSNAMHVHLTDQNGKSINATNRLPIIFKSQINKTVYPFQTVIESSLSTVSDISNTTIQLHSIGIANEFPITVWLKLYDLSTGKVTETTNGTTEFTSYVSDLVYNIAVPPGNYRDIHMSSGVKFTDGLHFRISQDFDYDSSFYDLGTDSGRVYVTGTYSQ